MNAPSEHVLPSTAPEDIREIRRTWSHALDKQSNSLCGWGEYDSKSPGVPKQFCPSLSVPGAGPQRGGACAPPPGQAWLYDCWDQLSGKKTVLRLPSQVWTGPGCSELLFRRSSVPQWRQASRGAPGDGRTQEGRLGADIQPEAARWPAGCKHRRPPKWEQLRNLPTESQPILEISKK